MIHLSRVLLIDWHNINYQVVELSTINFLTGFTGSGKSTFVDALQILLLGQADGTFFNKAASTAEKNQEKRSLKGYVYNRIGATREEEDQDELYLRRGSFSSYLVGEYKEIRAGAPDTYFCFGVIFDCAYPEKPTATWFSIKGPLPDNVFIEKNDIAVPGYEIKNYLRDKYGKKYSEVFPSATAYQQHLRLALGPLHERFHQQFRRAVPFDPSVNLAQFLSDYACDVETSINIEEMQKSVGHYAQLLVGADRVKEQVEALEKLCTVHNEFANYSTRAYLYGYVIDRSSADISTRNLNNAKENLVKMKSEISAMTARLPDLQQAINIALQAYRNAESDYAKEELVVKNRKNSIDSEIKQIDDDLYRISEIRQAFNEKKDKHHKQWQQSKRSVDRFVKTHAEIVALLQLVDKGIAQKYSQHLSDVPNYQSDIEQWMGIIGSPIESDGFAVPVCDHETIQALLGRLGELMSSVKSLHTLLSEVDRRLEEDINRLNQEIASLEKGVKPLDDKLRRFLGDLVTGLEANAPMAKVRLVGDCLEVKDEEWQNAIEGFLGRRRFHVLVEPQYHKEAVRVYQRLRRDKGYNSIGIIDTAKLLAERRQHDRGSLSEEIVTTDECARAYIDHVLGHVMKASSVEELSQYRTAMTKDCWRYQSYVREPLAPESYRDLYLGQKSLQLRTERAKRDLREKIERKNTLFLDLQSSLAISTSKQFDEADIADGVKAVQEVSRIGDLTNMRFDLDKEKNNIDESKLKALDQTRTKASEGHEAAVKEHQEIAQGIASRENDIKITEGNMPDLVNRSTTDQIKLHDYDINWVASDGLPYYEKQVERLPSLETVKDNYDRQMKTTATQKKESYGALIELRQNYAQRFPDASGGLDLLAENNSDWEIEWKKLDKSALPEYIDRITEAKKRAYEQFQNDFLSQLYGNISSAKNQINDLSAALKEVTFGNGISFRLHTLVKPAFKKDYEMIMDESLSQGQNLLSGAFQEKYGETFEKFFNKFIPVATEGLPRPTAREIVAEAVKLTDYRTYLDFEMEEIQADGTKISLTRSGGLRSGGEGQTVFYVSVLASFMKLYRVKNLANNHTFRLVVFDEAFSKMDHIRIKDSMLWLRETGLQILIAAPPEKMVYIEPHVDLVLMTSRSKEGTIIVPAQYKDGDVA